ncbi:MAG: precorrin-3B C(17)-methyltransferase [Lawsonibacter sp.]
MKRLYVIGMGPGGAEQLTPQALRALEDSRVVCGYTTYMDLAREFLEGKELVTTLMTRELERCRIALERAEAGETTAMICSGDAGVYGMAGPILQMAEEFPEVEIEVVPGITAALSGAAVLGAPLMHDFAVISLSDLLTPWEVIEKRLDCAGAGDFVVCLYNPMSRRRGPFGPGLCHPAEAPAGTTVCGWVKNIGRAGEERRLLTLEELEGEQVDMFTTVFIGSSSTQQLSGRMVTPRGYEAKA